VSIELFQRLNEEEKAQVKNAFHGINRMKVLVSHENSNLDITGRTLQCLMPTGWLNDEVVNLYLLLLKEREARDPTKYLKCHFFNSFFYTRLVGESGSNYVYKDVRRWTTNRKLGYDLIDCHMERKFMYLDSLTTADPTQILNALAKYFVDEVKDKNGKDIDVSSWDKVPVQKNLPRQHNLYDCGMFMLKYIDFYSRVLSLDFCQDDMQYFRIQFRKPAIAYFSPLTRNHDDDMKSIHKGIVDSETESESGSYEILGQAKDVPNMEHERVRNTSMETESDNSDKEESEEDESDNSDKEESEEDELCVLQDALEATSFFSGYQQKLLLSNLKKLKAKKINELSDEWKALLNEELQLKIKKLIFASKLASVGVSA
ncbi:hypothetical protein AALP_AA6G243000, partial [Arabis alpina]